MDLGVTASGTATIQYAWRKRGAGWYTNGTATGWTLTAGGGGFYVGSSANNGDGSTTNIDTGGNAWGMYNSSGGTAEAVRNFTAMNTGDVFYVQIDNGWVGSSMSVGFSLQNSSGQNMLEFYFTGGASYYKINKSGGVVDSTVPYTDDGLEITLTNTTPPPSR